MRLIRKSTYYSDLQNIIQFIEPESARTALQQYERIETKVQGLRDFPFAGRIGRIAGTRELVIAGTPFVAIYTVGAEVTIWRVLHGAQRWPRRFPRETRQR